MVNDSIPTHKLRDKPCASLCIALIGILLTTTLQSGCSTRINDEHAKASASPAASLRSSDDEILISEVEQFAGSESNDSDAAWKKLQSRDRSKLIADLTRISDASVPNDYLRSLIAFTFCRLGHEYPANRKIVVSAMSRESPFEKVEGDWAVNMITRLMIQGDSDLLTPLFEASNWSDGAMSTELASSYSQALLKEPETFLRLLSLQSESTRSQVMMLLKDNSFTADENAKVTAYLTSVSRQSKLRPIAEQTMRALTNLED